MLDGTPAIEEIVRRFLDNPEYANLPHKYKTAISGLQDVSHETHDAAFIGVNHPDHGPGMDLWVGGGLSTNPMLAQQLGAWVPLDEVPTCGRRRPRYFVTTATVGCVPRRE